MEPSSRPSLYPFQGVGVDFLRRESRALLADAPRLGKAVQSLNAAVGRTLVVAPSMVLESGGWQIDAETWFKGDSIEFTSYGLLNQRETTRPAGARAVSRVQDGVRVEWKGPWDTLILDESHHIKERKTKWTIAASQIDAERCFLLSGTPIPNWAHELFTTLRIIFPGDRRFTSYWRWIQEWFDTSKNRFNMAAIEIGGLKRSVTWSDFMRENLGSHYLRRTWKEAGVQMPPYERQVMYVKMHPAQRIAYQSMKKSFIAQFKDSEIQAWTTGAQTVRLAQICTGLESLGIGEKGSGKLDLVAELLDDYAGEPLVLFCHFRNTARALQKLCEARHLRVALVMGGEADRGGKVRGFQAGDYDILIGTIDTVSESLQMWRANICIFVEHVWRPTSNRQAMDRLAFIGKTTPIRAISLLTENSVDEGMWRLLQTKTDQQMRALSVREFSQLL